MEAALDVFILVLHPVMLEGEDKEDEKDDSTD